jgi:GntR family transcriptional regulator
MQKPVLTQGASLYQQVEATLKEMIEGLVYSPGDQIPSERELADQLGVSRMTVRRAVENLVRRGLLERRSTSGTYVRRPQVYRRVGKDIAVGITQLLQEEGAQAGSKLLSFETILAPLKIAEKLHIRLGVPVIVIRRLRTANGQPFCVETSYLPAELLPGLSADDLIDPHASLYRILFERYGIRLVKNNETLKLSYATHDEATLLGLKVGDPVLLLRSVVLDPNDRPVEYLVSVNHPERVIFQAVSTLAHER